MEIHIIWHGSRAYDELVQLRHKLLREPLGLSFSEQDLEAEEEETILAIDREQSWIACLHLRPTMGETIKLRQMCVHPEFQGQGLGESLIEAAEEVTGELGFSEIVLHARETAVGFYEKCGFAVDGEPFEEVGLPHRLMRKSLIEVTRPVSYET
jgi:predicted GNAT family N-acyltransferase